MKITKQDGQYLVSEQGKITHKLPSIGDAMRVAGMEPHPDDYQQTPRPNIPENNKPDEELTPDAFDALLSGTDFVENCNRLDQDNSGNDERRLNDPERFREKF